MKCQRSDKEQGSDQASRERSKGKMALEPLSERMGRLSKSVRDSKDLLHVDGLLVRKKLELLSSFPPSLIFTLPDYPCYSRGYRVFVACTQQVH